MHGWASVTTVVSDAGSLSDNNRLHAYQIRLASADSDDPFLHRRQASRAKRSGRLRCVVGVLHALSNWLHKMGEIMLHVPISLQYGLETGIKFCVWRKNHVQYLIF